MKNQNRGLFLALVMIAGNVLYANAEEYIYARDFGAKGDGRANDTESIQKAIKKAVSQRGGTVMLGAGVFMVDSLVLGIKTSLVGVGQGATIIMKRKTGGDCIVVPPQSAGLRIADMTINGLGSSGGIGIFIRSTMPPQGENRNYIWSSFMNWDKRQSYKWIQINNVSVCNFDIGLSISPYGFDINVSDCSFSSNGDGVLFGCTDSAIYDCYINNNRRNGLVIGGSNNRISSIKSIFNGSADAPKYAAVLVKGSRNMLVNIETQDNFCKAFDVNGVYNMFCNCLSNTDGYTSSPYHYDPATEACGFYVRKKYNTFSNCIVTNYNRKYGAIYKTPVIVSKEVVEWYPEIYKDIKVILSKDQVMFNEIEASPINGVSRENVYRGVFWRDKSGECYFKVSSGSRSYISKREDYDFGHLNVLVDYKVFETIPSYADLWTVGDGDRTLALKLLTEESGACRYSLLCGGKEICSLEIPDYELLVGKDQRVIVSFDSQTVSLVSYENIRGMGWIKKESELPVDTIDVRSLPYSHSTVSFASADSDLGLRRLILSYKKMLDDVFLPGSPTASLKSDSFLYLDADTWCATTFKSYGSRFERPSLGMFDAGFQYFDTTIGRPVWWNGKVWVNSNGDEV